MSIWSSGILRGSNAREEHQPDADARPIELTREVYEGICREIGSRRAEEGGMLGGDRKLRRVTHFHYDSDAERTGATYSPDTRRLNALLDDWNRIGVSLMGFVHSHPEGIFYPSGGDEVYAERILRCNSRMKEMLMPIVQPARRGGKHRDRTFQMKMFVASLDVRGLLKWQELPYRVVSDTEETVVVVSNATVEAVAAPLVVTGIGSNQLTAAADAPPTAPMIEESSGSQVEHAATSQAVECDVVQQIPKPRCCETFRRVEHAYHLDRLAKCRVVAVGVGGAAQFLEDLARCGVGQMVLIDGDTVSETNLATQQTYRRDLGRSKVDCVSERIRDINPSARVSTFKGMLDNLDDEAMRLCLFGAENPEDRPEQVLLLGLTDNFNAQARINRLGLKFSVPTLCAQVYERGLGAEITFTHPDVTKACHRCVLSSRYRAYRRQNFVNNVTSDGTPIFATGRLNATKGQIALALLHYGLEQSRWHRLLLTIGNRNLVQIRMSPARLAEFPLPAFDRAFGGADAERVLFDETVWLPQEPRNPELNPEYERCPECGGTGHLRDSRNRFTDTRIWQD